MEITDIEKSMNPVEFLSSYASDLAESARTALDIIVREIMYKGASKAFTGEATKPADVKRALTVDDIRNIAAQMKDDKVKKIGGR